MKKPKPNSNNVYDIHHIVDFIHKKYGINPYDFHGYLPHYDNWCNTQGYGQKDTTGKSRSESQIWFKAYQSHPQGQMACPPHEDFWDFFINEYSPQTDVPVYFDVKDAIEKARSPILIKVLQFIQDEFGGEIQCMIADF